MTAPSAPFAPANAWYPVAATEDVGRIPLARRLLSTPVVLYRTGTGAPAALEDRCAHRPVRLSDGTLDGDTIVSAYTGFAYAPDGRCVRVPTQDQVPYDASVRSFPVVDDGSFVWVWPGEPGLAALRPTPDTSLLRDPAWSTFGATEVNAAGIGLFLDNFCDITHVAHLDRAIAPPALSQGTTPPLAVTVSETSVKFSRTFSHAPLSGWHAQVAELPEDAEHEQLEEGEFVSPGYWVDRWTVDVKGHGAADGPRTFVFSHALTPISATSTQHQWRVSRNFSASKAADGTLRSLFEAYYTRVGSTLEGMQQILDEEGERTEVMVAADAAVTQVRRVLQRMILDEVGN